MRRRLPSLLFCVLLVSCSGSGAAVAPGVGRLPPPPSSGGAPASAPRAPEIATTAVDERDVSGANRAARAFGLRVLAGSLHDHSTDSDGDSASATVAQWLFEHRAALRIDFAGLSEHSDFFPAAAGAPTSLGPWQRQAALAQQYSHNGFSWLRGFEWTNDQENHINVIGSSNWTSRFTTGDAYLNMTPFWAWLAAPPTTDPTGSGLGVGGADGAGQFNHPGSKGALNWDDYRFDAAAANVMSLIEVHGDQGRGGMGNSDAGWYWFALSQGWNVSPTMNWDWHGWSKIAANGRPGAACGVEGYLPCQRTFVFADAPTPARILDALKARRTSASELPDFWAVLRTTSGALQGSTVTAAPGSEIRLEVRAASATTPVDAIDIVSDNDVPAYPYYYGDNTPCTPVGPYGGEPLDNCKPDNFVKAQLTISYVAQHARYVASNGHATRKAQIDGPPPGTVVATAKAQSGTTSVTVRVPAGDGTRPDHKHFFYAIVHAGAARVWTGPIFTSAQ